MHHQGTGWQLGIPLASKAPQQLTVFLLPAPSGSTAGDADRATNDPSHLEGCDVWDTGASVVKGETFVPEPPSVSGYYLLKKQKQKLLHQPSALRRLLVLGTESASWCS